MSRIFEKKVVKPDAMLNPLRNESEEDFYGDLTKTRKVHNDGSTVKTLFVGSILRGHRRKAERFWQTKSHAFITSSMVPHDWY